MDIAEFIALYLKSVLNTTVDPVLEVQGCYREVGPQKATSKCTTWIYNEYPPGIQNQNLLLSATEKKKKVFYKDKKSLFLNQNYRAEIIKSRHHDLPSKTSGQPVEEDGSPSMVPWQHKQASHLEQMMLTLWTFCDNLHTTFMHSLQEIWATRRKRLRYILLHLHYYIYIRVMWWSVTSGAELIKTK